MNNEKKHSQIIEKKMAPNMDNDSTNGESKDGVIAEVCAIVKLPDFAEKNKSTWKTIKIHEFDLNSPY